MNLLNHYENFVGSKDEEEKQEEMKKEEPRSTPPRFEDFIDWLINNKDDYTIKSVTQRP